MSAYSRLYYYDTKIMVKLGDRIDFPTLVFRKPRHGTVCCIPTKSARVLMAEMQDSEDWLLKFDNGTYTGWIYSPEDLQPNKRLKFLERGEPGYIGITNDAMERMEAEAEETW
jgi:hypothetical protein